VRPDRLNYAAAAASPGRGVSGVVVAARACFASALAATALFATPFVFTPVAAWVHDRNEVWILYPLAIAMSAAGSVVALVAASRRCRGGWLAFSANVILFTCLVGFAAYFVANFKFAPGG